MANLSEDAIHKELDLVQDIVKRMASNSFQVKAWLIGIFSALIAFSMEKLVGTTGSVAGIFTSLFLLVPIACFWYLDGFFLSTEKLYRELYKWVVTHRPKTQAYLYDLNTFDRTVGEQKTLMVKAENSVWNCMKSKTLLPFYVSPLVFVLLLLAYNVWAYSNAVSNIK